ncbi:GTP cyclohydrolase II [Podila minutissima]|nr:GTP cyclohydrolase II [Podila minutissima]
MACDISMDEPLVVAPAHHGYIPRNAIDHMNPFFFKAHHHHSHQKHSHSYYPQTTPEATPSTPIPSVDCLQNPVPRRRLSTHQIDHRLSTISNSSTSYSTPPATPPLLTLSSTATKTVAATAAAAVASTGSSSSPVAWCTARARIPTPDGSEYFLHMYENRMDKKEHLAFVFGDSIRSRSLDKIQPGETELDRVKRGAYTGRLRGTVSEELEQNRGASTTTTTTLDSTPSTVSGATSTTFTVPLTANLPLATKAPLVRIHSECFTGEIGHSARCDCGEQLDEAIRLMKTEGAGVVVYLRQEGRGIGLAEKLKAYNLQDLGYDTVMANLLLNHGADERTYEVAQGIMQDLGLTQIRLLTNNPDKIEQIEKDSQIKVVERVPMMPKSWEAIEQGLEAELEVREGAVENKIVRGKELDKYLKVKVERMRHLIPIPTAMSS